MFPSPMLLLKADSANNDESYICELKLDGIRLILSNVDGQLQCWTRHGTPCLDRFPELAALDLPPGTIIDGELIVVDKKGHPDFEAVMKRFQTTNPVKAQALIDSYPVEYCVFDLLRLRGEDVTRLPLMDRKALLEEHIGEQDHLALVRWIPGEQGKAFFDLISDQGLEGIVMKKKDSLYQVGKRSHDWLKVINYHYHDVRLTGLRKGEFGWLIGVEKDGKVRPAGLIEFPPPPYVRKAVWSIAEQGKIGEDKNYIYLDPQIRMKVKSRGWTKRGMIRLPVFQEFLFERSSA
jgi:DNA ligase-1